MKWARQEKRVDAPTVLDVQSEARSLIFELLIAADQLHAVITGDEGDGGNA